MAKQKISHIIVFLGLLSFVSCRKEVAVEVNLKNPVDGTGYAGLECDLYLYSDNPEFIKSVTTDANGYAKLAWEGRRRSYELRFNTANVVAPPGEYYSTVIPSQIFNINTAGNIDGNGKGPYNFKFIPYGSVVRHFKNVNCFDENDVMMFKQLLYHTSFSEWYGIAWNQVDLGCYENLENSVFAPSNVEIYQIKVTRNGIDSIYYDTFINHPYVTDTFKIFY